MGFTAPTVAGVVGTRRDPGAVGLTRLVARRVWFLRLLWTVVSDGFDPRARRVLLGCGECSALGLLPFDRSLFVEGVEARAFLANLPPSVRTVADDGYRLVRAADEYPQHPLDGL